MNQSEAIIILKTETNDAVRRKAFVYLNNHLKLSLNEIARELGTYTNKIRREFKKLGIESLDRSEIQTELLRTGKIEHPTKGKTLSDETKTKISDKIAKEWEDNPEKREKVGLRAKERWENMSKQEKEASISRASGAIREAAKEGSHLERFLRDGLYEAGYVSIGHKVGVLPKEKLEFDLYIPELALIIEVDGPSHFEPIWGAKVLKKNKERDRTKAGLALARGLKFIRVRQTRNYSQFYFRSLLTSLLALVAEIKKGVTKEQYFEI